LRVTLRVTLGVACPYRLAWRDENPAYLTGGGYAFNLLR